MIVREFTNNCKAYLNKAQLGVFVKYIYNNNMQLKRTLLNEHKSVFLSNIEFCISQMNEIFAHIEIFRIQ